MVLNIFVFFFLLIRADWCYMSEDELHICNECRYISPLHAVVQLARKFINKEIRFSLPSFIRLIIAAGGSVNELDSHGLTPLNSLMKLVIQVRSFEFLDSYNPRNFLFNFRSSYKLIFSIGYNYMVGCF